MARKNREIDKGGLEMTLAKYCKSQGYDEQTYMDLRRSLQKVAARMLEEIKREFNPGSGMYYPVSELATKTSEVVFTDGILRPFIITELKALGVEFYDNSEMFRY